MAINMIALAYAATNNREAAKTYLAQLRTMRMPFEDYLNNFAEFLMSVGRPGYALGIIETALEMDTKDSRFPGFLRNAERFWKDRIRIPLYNQSRFCPSFPRSTPIRHSRGI